MIATAVIIATTTANTFRPITRPPVFELIKALAFFVNPNHREGQENFTLNENRTP
jgi:hypothetical protein